jgi:hypothetical protein
MPKRYPPDIIATAKQLLIYEGWSPRKVADFLGDQGPHWQTIQNWADETGASTGKNWYDLRDEYLDSVVNQISPKQIEQLYMQRIYEMLSDPQFSTKHSDSLRKLQKDFRQITDPGNQIPVVYAMLTELIGYLKKYHAALLGDKLLDAIQDFKNFQRNKLQS